MKFDKTKIHCPKCGKIYDVDPEVYAFRDKLECRCKNKWEADSECEKLICYAMKPENFALSWVILMVVEFLCFFGAFYFAPLLLILCIIHTVRYFRRRKFFHQSRKNIPIIEIAVNLEQKKTHRLLLMLVSWGLFLALVILMLAMIFL